jgi:AcrR family transcriptional regulator
MPSRNRGKRSGEATRQRILKSAVARFARSSYEDVKLRDIAHDVGIDVAYVCRSFGSKQQLFIEAFNATAHTAQSLLAADAEDPVGAFTKHMRGPKSVGLRILCCSLSSAQARKVLRTYATKNFMEPLAAQLAEPALLRAALVGACLTGIKVMRDVLCVHPLTKARGEEFLPLFEGIMRACLETRVFSHADRPRRRAQLNGSTAQAKLRRQRKHRARTAALSTAAD